jgi:DNA-binding PucR family transcriptional regulator
MVVSRGTPDRPTGPTPSALGRRPDPAQRDQLMALLLRTLLAYHGRGCDLARTSAALGIHRSTVRYRLYRIRELTGLGPEDPRSVQVMRDID